MILDCPKAEKIIDLRLFKPEIGNDWANSVIYKYISSVTMRNLISDGLIYANYPSYALNEQQNLK